jgi:DNA-binding IclR family transcriptional regulator
VSAEDRIIRAITVPGPAPHVHEQQIQRLAREWPTLAQSLAVLLKERGLSVPPAWRPR